jgi:prevent-host-death family protein
MRTIELSDFDEHFDAVMDAVAQGERFVITRGGRPIAKLAPRGEQDRDCRVSDTT